MGEISLSMGFSIMRMMLLSQRSRALLRSSLNKCEKCGKRPIDMFFDEYLGIRHKKCIKCRSIVTTLKFFTDITMKALNVERGALERVVKIPYWRKGLTATVKGLAWFGVRKPFVTGAPLFVVWNFTNRCNLKCKHCYQDAGANLQSELTREEAIGVVKELADADVSSIAFSGGEPLMRKDFFDVASYAKELGMYITVATNGTLITKDMAKQLSRAVHYVEVSLDGIDPRTHDEFRGVPGSWQRTVSAIKYLIEEGVQVGVATTATKQNISEIPSLIDFIEKLGVDYFICFNFIPAGRGTEIVEKDPSPEEREELLKYLYKRLVYNMINKRKMMIYTTAPQFARVGLEMKDKILEQLALMDTTDPSIEPIVPATHYGNVPGITPETAEFIGGCGAGRVYAALSPEGDVQPCVFMPIKLGNLRSERFEDIWLNSEVLNELRDREKLKGGCGSCSYKYVCGGCRARAYGYYGDFHMPDPGCIRRMYDTCMHDGNLMVPCKR